MVELRQSEGGLFRRGFAGDTFNTAFYLRAFLPAAVPVEYFTAVGTDPASAEMLASIEAAGVGTGFIRRVPDRQPGLYMIHLDRGERSFSYWRSVSAARLLADDPASLRRAIDASDTIFFSGITLAILAPEAAAALLAEIGRAREAGKLVAFDPNIRPNLWDSPERMCQVISAGAAAAGMVMPSFEDEARHFGDRSIHRTIDRYHGLGVDKVVVKDGAEGITLSFAGGRTFVPSFAAGDIVDTTGAGDSFNGAFLASYLVSGNEQAAAEFAARVAATVIGYHGALVDRSVLAGLAEADQFSPFR